MRNIPANLIALDPSASYSEGERPADDQMTPPSIPMSFNVMDPVIQSIHYGSYGLSSKNHWLLKVFNQSLQSSPTTLEENADLGSSECFGEHVPDAMAKLDREAYTSLAEFRFQNDQFIVRLYDQRYGYSPGILCSTKRSTRHEKDSWQSLAVLAISRRGSFLDLTLNDGVEEPPGLWACIKFPDYESTFINTLYLGLLLGWRSCCNASHYLRGL